MNNRISIIVILLFFAQQVYCQCEKYTKMKIDKFEKDTTRTITYPLTNASYKLVLELKQKTSQDYLIVDANVINLYYTEGIDMRGAYIHFLFEDGSDVKMFNDEDVALRLVSYFRSMGTNISFNSDSIKQAQILAKERRELLLKLKSERLSAMRLRGPRHQIDFELDSNTQNELKMIFNCVDY